MPLPLGKQDPIPISVPLSIKYVILRMLFQPISWLVLRKSKVGEETTNNNKPRLTQNFYNH